MTVFYLCFHEKGWKRGDDSLKINTIHAREITLFRNGKMPVVRKWKTPNFHILTDRFSNLLISWHISWSNSAVIINCHLVLRLCYVLQQRTFRQRQVVQRLLHCFFKSSGLSEFLFRGVVFNHLKALNNNNFSKRGLSNCLNIIKFKTRYQCLNLPITN